MAAAPLIATAIALLLAGLDPAALPGAAPLLLLWFASPEIARLISRKRQRVAETLRPEDRLYLRLIARRTWLYFETFAGPDDNWLPPDNYQASPHEEIAHRSSPTNVGMLFLSALTAWDLGHIGLRDLVRADDRRAGHARSAGELCRPHAQLVRHEDTQVARAALCLDGRQRQSGGQPADAPRRLHGGREGSDAISEALGRA